MMWDTGGWKLNSEKADIQFIAPKSGALGWIDTFAIPAKGKNDAAAYAWINFNMRPRSPPRWPGGCGQLHRLQGRRQADGRAKLKAQFAASFPQAALEQRQVVPRRAGRPGRDRRPRARPHQGRQLRPGGRATPIPDAGRDQPRPGSPACRQALRRACGGGRPVVLRRARQLLLDPRPSGCGKTTLLRMIAGFLAARFRRHPASAASRCRRAAQPAAGEHGVSSTWRCSR
jgi:hypothetical protein